MDFLMELLFEVYLDLMMIIVPEKNISKKHKNIAKVIAILVLFGVLALAFWGIVLIVDYNNLLGIIPLAVAIIISLAQIILSIILYNKFH